MDYYLPDREKPATAIAFFSSHKKSINGDLISLNNQESSEKSEKIWINKSVSYI